MRDHRDDQKGTTMQDWQKYATPRYDDDGKLIEEWATCGTCGRTWNDALTSSRTPVPSARCPFEDLHDAILDGDVEHVESIIDDAMSS